MNSFTGRDWGRRDSRMCITCGPTAPSPRWRCFGLGPQRSQAPLTRMALRFWIEQAFWGLSWMNRYQLVQHGTRSVDLKSTVT